MHSFSSKPSFSAGLRALYQAALGVRVKAEEHNGGEVNWKCVVVYLPKDGPWMSLNVYSFLETNG